MWSQTDEVFPHPNPARYYIFKCITSLEDFSRAVEAGKSVPVVLMFLADGNQLCDVMEKPFADLARAQKKRAVFCQVYIKENKLKNTNIADQYRVEALPTFVLIKNGKVMNRVVGAKEAELKSTIENNI